MLAAVQAPPLLGMLTLEVHHRRKSCMGRRKKTKVLTIQRMLHAAVAMHKWI